MNSFTEREGTLYINGHEVIKGWESASGWYWLATENTGTQDSVLDDGLAVPNDTIWFGLVQGFEEEWGYWSEGELGESIARGLIWEIPSHMLVFAGRREPR